MGTASTMNSLAEALGMMLPGCAAIPAPHKERGQVAYYTGRRAVEMVAGGPEAVADHDARGLRERHWVNSAIGGSTNAPIHLNAIASHLGITLTNDDGSISATRCRCSSTCSRPGASSARIITARRRAGRGGGADRRRLLPHPRP
jgi:dihydroxyacid dehydratase/phosphogluconate dehydratase